jgi:PAS domain S-box-containing protein
MPEHRHDSAVQDAELQSERAQFALAERAARFGYWRLRLADNHLTWSPGMYALLDIPPEQKADNAWLLAQIVPEDVGVLLEQVNHAIRSRSGFYYRSRAKDPAVTAQIVDTHGEVEIGPDGKVVSVIGVCHDVTKQVKAETERKRAEEMYRMMAEHGSDIIMLHQNGKVVFASAALERVLKRKPEEIQGGRYLELVHPDDYEEAEKLRGHHAPGETRTATYRALHGDGHYVWLESTTRGVHDEGADAFFREISTARDVTERKTQELRMRAAQERAETANRAKSTFLANMSHELRTPLNAIIGFADIMREQMFGPIGNERYREYATLVYDSGQHLLDLITDILDMAKIEAGKLELNLECVDVSGMIADCVRLLHDRATDAHVTMEAVLPECTLPLTADKRAVKQILLNLLSNALKFTPEGGHIFVSATEEENQIALAVRDTGIGIPTEQLPRLGRPFEQVCANASLAKGGTGLGLALVRALAEKHGGNMQISSAEGEGTTVTVRLPITQSGRAAA